MSHNPVKFPDAFTSTEDTTNLKMASIIKTLIYNNFIERFVLIASILIIWTKLVILYRKIRWELPQEIGKISDALEKHTCARIKISYVT